jgi:hypothetical protein
LSQGLVVLCSLESQQHQILLLPCTSLLVYVLVLGVVVVVAVVGAGVVVEAVNVTVSIILTH